MRTSLRSCVGSVLFVFICAASIAQFALADDAAPPPAVAFSPAEPLVQQALKAEAAGNAAGRDSLIQKAIAADPSYAPAHWHNGEVRVKERWTEVWQPVDRAAKELARTGKVAQYRRMNPTLNRNADNARKLGDWCAAAGLQPQARMHWMNALRQKPKLKDVQQKLDFVRYRNGFVQADEVAQIQQNEADYAATFKQWNRRLEKLQRDASVDSPSRQSAASQELKEVTDPTAIPAMEALSVNGGPVFGVAVAGALAKMSGPAASGALVRQSVCSQYPEVRQAAGLALREHSVFAFAPTLMGLLQPPIRFQEVEGTQNGVFAHQLTMFQEGPFAAQAMQSTGSDSTDSLTEISHVTHRVAWTNPNFSYHPDQSRDRDMQLASRAAAYNSVAKVWNTNAIATLRTATGLQLDDAPTSWWNWWLNYNEIYQNPQKPLYVSTSQYTAPQPKHYIASCFIAGTKVWAMDGPMPIENVQVGEWILAQNPATGELAYKPVLATTIRPPSPVRAIQIQGDTIVATRGHPFWVSGKGWQMTKELNPGQHLHTVAGPVDIQSAEYVGEAVCHNLVVSDFGTYFVGEQKVLVHDNTIRDVSPALVPGLITH